MSKSDTIITVTKTPHVDDSTRVTVKGYIDGVCQGLHLDFLNDVEDYQEKFLKVISKATKLYFI